MQEEIDCYEDGDDYGKLVEKYENLYKSKEKEEV